VRGCARGGRPERIIAQPVVANGRVYVASQEALYAIGPKAPKVTTSAPTPPAAAAPGALAAGRATPADINLKPGQTQKFTVDVFDANGVKLAGPAPSVTWALQGLK